MLFQNLFGGQSSGQRNCRSPKFFGDMLAHCDQRHAGCAAILYRSDRIGRLDSNEERGSDITIGDKSKRGGVRLQRAVKGLLEIIVDVAPHGNLILTLCG